MVHVITEAIALAYIMLGLVLICYSHFQKHGATYLEITPVILRMTGFTRWLFSKFRIK